MIFKQSGMVAILFFQSEARIFHRQKKLQAMTCYGLFLYSEALEPIMKKL